MADFQAVAAAALARSEELLPAWLPGGKRCGQEWVCGSVQGGPGESCSTNFTTGRGGDFASDSERWGDLVSLYSHIHSLTQGEACRELAHQFGLSNGHANGATSVVQTPQTPAPQERGPEPIPADTPDPALHRKHGAPSAVYRYGDAFAIARYDTERGKAFAQWTWRGGAWVAKSYPAPRPLYGLPLAPELHVLVVEGEKCADAAIAAGLPYAVVTWAGGAQAAKTADWTPLKGRDVVLWPDADAPGAQAMAGLAQLLMPIASSLSVVRPSGQPEGWDLADAVAEGWNAEVISAWMAQRTIHIDPQASSEAPRAVRVGRAHDGRAPLSHLSPLEEGAVGAWQSLGLQCNSGGVPFPTIANIAVILRSHPRFAGKIWFDDFRGKIMRQQGAQSTPWADADDLFLVDFIQNGLKISRFGLQTVTHGVQLAAFANRRNSVVSWLDSLRWDETERLSLWLGDFLGARNTAYEQAAGRNWLISMVARAYQPGCQADHMPVLEGASGRGKSSALRILGGQWYRAAPQAFGSKEFLEVIQGSWLIEIPDMVGFGRREHSQIISAITTPSDPYRASYGRHAEDHQRTCIFVATSETDDYLQDSRGIRRYWPIRCSEINLRALAAAREQLFAEAVGAFKRGESWHEMPSKETAEEQGQRQELDVWTERIADWVGTQTEVSVSNIATTCLFMEINKIDRGIQMRIARVLKLLGFRCEVGWSQGRGRPVRVYRR